MHVSQIAAPMVPEVDRSLRQIGNYIREATDRKTTPPLVQSYYPCGGLHCQRWCTGISAQRHRRFRLKAVAAVHNSPSNRR
jgi:hypothetical protein